MNIAVIGTGNVGGALGTGLAKAGHSVVFGVRDAGDPDLAKLLEVAGKNARAGSVPEALKSAEVVILAIPWRAAGEVIKSNGGLGGKILLDCTNPLKPDISGLEIGHTTSAAEQIASWAPGAKIVKIFNSTGAQNMANPRYSEGPVTMFYCGDDEAAKQIAAQLATDLGFEPIDAGSLTVARLLESYAMLWIHLAYRQKMGVNLAFRLMRR